MGVCDQAQKFINAYSAFLKRQGKLPIPGMYIAVLSHGCRVDQCPSSLANHARRLG